MTTSLHLDPLIGSEDLKPSPVSAKPSWWERKQSEWKKRWDDMNSDPVRRGKFRRNAAIAAVVLLLAGGGAYWKWGIVHQPDFAVDDLDDIFDYTLLTDDFNRRFGDDGGVCQWHRGCGPRATDEELQPAGHRHVG